ncbi:DNA mismatch repair endonuclease MutL [Histophilus somni]|uniref:DNA mismatch repair endonuclease MutL n=1 Tax=Histophilus somni TaxID=731 RepID=UPI00201F2774|nr:DNA mismatch repair endonuclease MutL [Histophilus somni]
MTIKILPPQLANQIAAGEVVERPASVVKELIENSLDAGATHIQIEIENGGANLIRIRDNGIGIAKDELHLALARHATSKIASLDDLEMILSLGFRGEALASISSVSRLTLTSRTAQQNEAWQVYAQGRDMETSITPASHPIGTTVEVANLFFNTPARRKFLRTNKTEFAHIDEVIRRIALAKPQVAFTLTHNNKLIHRYKSAVTNEQKIKRIATICGNDFMQNALHIDWKHNDLHLSGWVIQPQFARHQNDLNYCYINGRMVRDKVITHAIRQAYSEYLSNEKYPAFVLFIDLNPNEVDVNVHPTKHEVRFHQARLIHDFIYQGMTNALTSEQTNIPIQSEQSNPTKVAEPQGIWNLTTHNKGNRATAGKNIFAQQPKDYDKKSSQFKPHFTANYSEVTPKKAVQKAYAELLATHEEKTIASSTLPHQFTHNATHISEQKNVLHALALIENKALLLQQNQQYFLLSIQALQHFNIRLQLQQSNIAQQTLLIPILLRLNKQQYQSWQQQALFFQQSGFDFTENSAQHRITLNRLPICLRTQNIQKIILHLLDQPHEKYNIFLTALCSHLEFPSLSTFSEAVNLLTKTEQQFSTQYQPEFQSLLVKIEWDHYLDKLQ